MSVNSILWNVIYLSGRIVRLASLCGFIILGSFVAMFYILDLILYIFRLGRYYYEYLLYYYSERNRTTLCINNKRKNVMTTHERQCPEKDNNDQKQMLLQENMVITTNVTGVDQNNNMDPNLKLLRFRLKKYYTKFFNH